MVSAEGLAARYEAVCERYREYHDQIIALQQRALQELLPALVEELDLADQQAERVKAFLSDQISVWRFLRRARFDEDQALKLLRNTLNWRISSSLDLLAASALDPLYIDHPVFFFHPRLVDRFGRPAAILNLKHVRRTSDGTLDAFKEYIALGCETGRRYLSELSRKRKKDEDPVLQLVLIVDLADSGMANLEIELLPFLLDLLKSHFPSMVSAMFILNFGWAYAGMWAVAKRVLPQPALDRIMFPKKDDLLEFFSEDALLKEHGGSVRYKYTFKGSILARIGRPKFCSPSPSATASPFGSRTPSRASSYESIADVYHSAGVSPRSSRPGTPSGAQYSPHLSMTSLATAVAANEKKPDARPLRRNTSSQCFRSHMPTQDPADDSSDSQISGDEAVKETVKRRRSVARGEASPAERASPAASREASPQRARTSNAGTPAIPAISITADSPQHTDMSPFSSSNPYWGYRVRAGGRRRKRDLFRTLSYLFFLRILTLRRSIVAEMVALFDYVILKLRRIGLLPQPAPPPTPPEPERQPRRNKRRKAVTFVELEDIDEGEIDRRARRRKRLTHAARAVSPSARRSREPHERMPPAMRLILALSAILLLCRSRRIVVWARRGLPQGRRASLRARLGALWPLTSA